MKKNLSLLLILAVCTALLPGCLKDQCKSTYHYTYYQPVYKTTAQVRADIRSNAPQPIERPGKIYVKGSYIFLNEIDKGIHVIDNTNPSAPVNKAFIDIPGNMDLAVKGNTLYADLYTDLVSIDISNPTSIAVTKILEGVFPYRYYGNFLADSTKVIAAWEKRDTTVTEDCSGRQRWSTDKVFVSYAASSSSGTSAAVSPYGVGGSMARFTITADRLYAVSNSDLSVFQISTAAQPVFSKKTNVGWTIETIYPFKNSLFIGSQTGMFVYNINNPDNPVQTGQFSHVRSCDPVIADNDYAYVTLRSGTACGGFTNQLDVLRVNTAVAPLLFKTYPLTNPHGLAKDGNLLFICDGPAGLKLYNAADASNLQLLNVVSNLDTYDVIAFNKTAIVVAKDGLYQYSYSNPASLSLLSKINISK